MEKKRTIKHEGVLHLGEYKIPCYVLNDGTRVLSGRGMQDALKMVDEKEEGKQKAGTRLARYFNQKTLKPFLINKFSPDHFAPIICYKGEAKINGYEATLLADICDGILDARNHIALSSRQEIIAKQCEILIRGFAKVGIIALVDEATGNQYEREQFELQAILKAYISDEILEWQKTFQLGFYKEIFRLWGVPFTDKNIKRKPPFIGTLTNSFIYKNMPKGIFVLEKLKAKTPRTKGGNYKYRLFQSLTPEVGREALKKVLYSVEALASISRDKAHFLKLMQDKYGQPEIPFLEYQDFQSVEEPDSKESVAKEKARKKATADKYDTKLQINASFEDVIGLAMSGNPKSKKDKK